MNEIEEILNRVKTHQSVDGYIITNINGQVIKSTLIGDKIEERDKILSFIPNYVFKTLKSIKNINEENELQCLRIKTLDNELIITPDADLEFIFIVIQSNSNKLNK